LGSIGKRTQNFCKRDHHFIDARLFFFDLTQSIKSKHRLQGDDFALMANLNSRFGQFCLREADPCSAFIPDLGHDKKRSLCA
jgi:hypothetical protein